MNPVLCGRCGQAIPPGTERFVLAWKLFADYDGIIDIVDASELEKTLDLIQKASARDLEEKVYQERCHILCQSCRGAIREVLAELIPVNSIDGTDPPDEDGQGGRSLH